MNTTTRGFTHNADGSLVCPHRDLSVCTECASQPGIVEVCGAHYDDPDGSLARHLADQGRTVHPEIDPDAQDRTLTECDDDTCTCHEMTAEAAAGGFKYVWNPQRYPGGGYDRRRLDPVDLLAPDYRATVTSANLDWQVAQFVRFSRLMHVHSSN